MSIKLGLTGSIGMGKSTTAGFFRDFGVPVWDADAVVHELYSKGGAAVEPVGEIAPMATVQGFVDRSVLKELIANDPHLLSKIEDVIRPLLVQNRAQFVVVNNSARLLLFDIPLLFETDAESWMDYVLVVTAPLHIQRQRVFSRGTMSEEMFTTILSRQMPDNAKRALADFVFDTYLGMDHTKAEVKALIEKLGKENA